MHSLGFLTLGASAGLLAGLIRSAGRYPSGFSISMAALAPVLMSGALVFLHPKLAKAESVHFYGIGLFLALMWQQAGAGIKTFNLPPKYQHWPTIAHITASVILTGVAIILALL